MNEIKKYWKLIFVLLFVLCCLPIIFYVIQFSSLKISNDPNYWGIFGTYFSGVLSPFLSLINIIVLAYLTYLVSKHEDSSKLNEFRYKAYIELTAQLDTLKENSLTLENLNSVEHYLKGFCFNNLFLFDGKINITFQHRVADISSAVSSLRIKLQVEEEMKKDEKNIHELAKKVLDEIARKELRELFDKFQMAKFTLVGFIQRVMINGNIEPYKTENMESFRKEKQS